MISITANLAKIPPRGGSKTILHDKIKIKYYTQLV